MKKLVLILFFAPLCLAGYGTPFGDGSGKGEANAINIDSNSAWQTFVADDGNKAEGRWIKVTADVNFDGASIICCDWNVDVNCTFDGQGHTFSNMIVRAVSGNYTTALFGQLGTRGTIKNLNCTNITVDGNGTCVTNNSSYVGLLVGQAGYGSLISNCIINGNVSHVLDATEANPGYVGMIGCSHGMIADCNFSGTVSASTETGATLSVGTVGYITGGASAGQLGEVNNCSSTVTVTNSRPSSYCRTYVGGMVGRTANSINSNIVRNSRWKGTINYSSAREPNLVVVGGLAALNDGSIYGSSAEGWITVDSNSSIGVYVGGMVGIQQSIATSSIIQSYADCNISVNYNNNVVYVGGLLGYGYLGAIRDCYAKGNLFDANIGSTALKFTYGGGFAGRIIAALDINNCFCDTKPFSGTGNVKGFVGLTNLTTAQYCHWDKSTSGMTTGTYTGIDGNTTTEMMLQSNYPNYDFTNVWYIDANYPVLRACKYQIPDIVGEANTVDANAIIRGAGYFSAGTITSEYNNTIAKGAVISQSPVAGAYANGGSAINYVISKGRKNSGWLGSWGWLGE